MGWPNLKSEESCGDSTDVCLYDQNTRNDSAEDARVLGVPVAQLNRCLHFSKGRHTVGCCTVRQGTLASGTFPPAFTVIENLLFCAENNTQELDLVVFAEQLQVLRTDLALRRTSSLGRTPSHPPPPPVGPHPLTNPGPRAWSCSAAMALR